MNSTAPGSQAAQPFRLALVGAGLITRNAHLPTALSLPGVRVTAIVDPVTKRAAELAGEYRLDVKIASDANEVIGQVDGAIIATPNHTHRRIAVPLLEAGVSTLIEKPLATTVEDGRAILEAAERGRSRVAVGYYQRFLDAPRLLDTLIRSGHFGRIFRFLHQYGSVGGWSALSAYTLQRDAIGGGVLVVTGTHFLDRMLHTWGMPDEVELRDDALGGPESHCEGRVRYSAGPFAGLEGLVRYSKCVALPAGLVLDTESGTVLLRDGADEDVILIPRGRPELRLTIRAAPAQGTPAPADASQRMVQDFVTACRLGRPPLVDGAQGLASLELLARFYSNRRPLENDWTAGRNRA
jgi:predicted dehydrogenase